MFPGFDFVIEYKPDSDNIASDYVSLSFMMAFSNQQSLLLQQMHQAIAANVNLSSLKTQCADGTQLDPHYQVQHDLHLMLIPSVAFFIYSLFPFVM